MRILVVEDDYLLSQALCYEVATSGGEVLGPYLSVEAALDQLDQAQGAILDVDLQGQTSFGLADQLRRRQVPFVFLTGHDIEIVPGRFDRRRVYSKPSPGSLLVGDLRRQRLVPQQAPALSTSDMDILETVREMMVLARKQMPDRDSAERLVESALVRAITETIDRPLTRDVRARLLDLMRDEFRARGRNLLH